MHHVHNPSFIKILSYIFLEITNLSDIEAAAEKVKHVVKGKGLHLLVNSAGIVNYEHSQLENVTAESLMSTFNVNTVGPAMLTKVVIWFLFFLFDTVHVCFRAQQIIMVDTRMPPDLFLKIKTSFVKFSISFVCQFLFIQ